MNIEERIRMLLKRLTFLGYCNFQIEKIIGEAIGQRPWIKTSHRQNMQILLILEKYEKLGSEYLLSYSK